MPTGAVVLSVLMFMTLFIDVSLSARIELFEHEQHKGHRLVGKYIY